MKVDRIAQVPFEPKGGESMLKAKNELLGPNEDLSSAVPMLGTRQVVSRGHNHQRKERDVLLGHRRCQRLHQKPKTIEPSYQSTDPRSTHEAMLIEVRTTYQCPGTD